MGFSYDINNKLIQPKLFLANPNKDYIGDGTIQNVNHPSVTLKFNNMWEISFDVYEYLNGEYYDYYDKLENKRLVEVQNLAWFQIVECQEYDNDETKERYKSIKCLTLENELVGKKVDDINGVFALFDESDLQHSIMHIFTANTGWSISYIDPLLLNKYRVFNIDSAQIYNCLTTDISKSYECVFVFNTYYKTISAYKLSNIGTTTDIVISRKNILKEWIKQSSSDQIVTKLKVLGSDDVDIRAVNPTGMNYLINLDYFMTTEWVSQGLIDAWNVYKTKQTNYLTTYNTTLSTLKSYKAELTILEAELIDLNSLKLAKEGVKGASVQLHGRVPISSDSDYTIYQSAITAIASYITQIKAKEINISNKKAQIISTQAVLDNISVDLDISTNFTQAQFNEMIPFITENDEYQDSTFLVTDTMTQEEIIDMKLELMSNGANELARASQPQYTIDIDASSLFTIQDGKDSLISYSEWRNLLDIGNIITIKFRENYNTTARLIEMVIDFDNPEDCKLKFSDKSRLDDELIQLAEIIKQSGRTASSISMKMFGYDKASDQASAVKTFITGSLNATLNRVISDDEIQTELGQYGLINRKWLPDQNKYDNGQSWLTQNVLLFTDDAWITSKLAIGKITAPDGNSYYGLATDVIVGDLIMGNKLKITNSSGTYTINDSGMIASATVGENTYSVGINPSVPNNIFHISVNSSDKFYIDTVNNRINAELWLNAIGGTLGSLTVTGTLQGGYINGSSITVNNGLNTVSINPISGIELYKGSIKTLYFNAEGNAVFSGDITGSTITGTKIKNIYINGTYTTETNISHNIHIGHYFEEELKNVLMVDYNGIEIIDPIYGHALYNAGGISSVNGSNSFFVSTTEISLQNSGGYVFGVNNLGLAYMGHAIIHSGMEGIHYNGANGSYGSYSFTPSYHEHSNVPSHYQSSYTIIPEVTTAGNISLYGSPNAASPPWCEATFQPLVSSDFRLKKNILTLNLPDELFMQLKPKQFEFKCDDYNKGVVFGLIAQQLESAFLRYGLNPYDYNLIELVDVKKYTDEGLYVDDKVHRINYNNIIPWLVSMVQKQHLRISQLESIN